MSFADRVALTCFGFSASAFFFAGSAEYIATKVSARVAHFVDQVTRPLMPLLYLAALWYFAYEVAEHERDLLGYEFSRNTVWKTCQGEGKGGVDIDQRCVWPDDMLGRCRAETAMMSFDKNTPPSELRHHASHPAPFWLTSAIDAAHVCFLVLDSTECIAMLRDIKEDVCDVRDEELELVFFRHAQRVYCILVVIIILLQLSCCLHFLKWFKNVDTTGLSTVNKFRALLKQTAKVYDEELKVRVHGRVVPYKELEEDAGDSGRVRAPPASSYEA